MEITYTLTPVDFDAFTNFQNGCDPSTIKLPRILLSNGIIALILAIPLIFFVPLLAWSLNILLPCLLALAYIFLLRLKRSRRSISSRRPTTLSLSSDGLTQKSSDGAILTYWTAVSRFEKTTDYIFLYIDANVAILVPRRAFVAEAEYDEFASSARRHIEAAATGRITTSVGDG